MWKYTANEFVHLGGSELGIFQANVSDPTASILPASIVGQITARSDVAHATPLLLMVETIKAEPAAVVFGADPSGFFTHNLVLVKGIRPHSAAHEILVGDRLAEQLHLAPGTTLTVKGRAFRVAGVYNSGVLFEDSGAVLAIEQARQLTGRSGEETDIVVQLTSGARCSSAWRSACSAESTQHGG